MCRNSAEDSKKTYRSMKNKARKAVLKSMGEKAEEVLIEWRNFTNGMVRLINGLNFCTKEVDGARCMS